MEDDDSFFSSSHDDSSVNSEEELSSLTLPRIRQNNPYTKELNGSGDYHLIQNFTDEEWEELGRDLSNNTHLKELSLFLLTSSGTYPFSKI